MVHLDKRGAPGALFLYAKFWLLFPELAILETFVKSSCPAKTIGQRPALHSCGAGLTII